MMHKGQSCTKPAGQDGKSSDDERSYSSLHLQPGTFWHDDIVRMTSNYPWSTPSDIDGGIDGLSIVCRTFHRICAEWLSACAFLESLLHEAELLCYASNDLATGMTQGDSMLKAINTVTEWRNSIREWPRMIEEIFEQALPVAR